MTNCTTVPGKLLPVCRFQSQIHNDVRSVPTSGFFTVGMCPYRTALQKPVCEAEKCAAKWFRSRKVRFAATKLRDCRSKTATWK